LQPQGISTTSIQASTAKIVIPQQSQPKVIGQVSEFEFEYVKTRLVSGGALGTKNTVELDRKRGKAQYMRENLGNGVTLDLVRISAGKFMMGSNENENEYDDREKPIHEVFVPEFWMGKYAVTQKQWQSVMGNNPSNFKGENLPVEKVSWHEARDFCAEVSKTTGKPMRLPTEAEWEYACRAGTNTPFAPGKTITPDLVNYDGNRPYGDAPKGEYRQKTLDVNDFYPNGWGLYQMHGNVWEWCLDEWHNSYISKPSDLKKNGDRAWEDIYKNDNRDRLLRGGTWCRDANYSRSAYRGMGDVDSRGNHLGFRVAATVVPVT